MDRSAAAKLERKRITEELLVEEGDIPSQSEEEIEESRTRSISTQTDEQLGVSSRSVQVNIQAKVCNFQTSFPVFLTLGRRKIISERLTVKVSIYMLKLQQLLIYLIFYSYGKNEKTQVDCGPQLCVHCQNQTVVTTSDRYPIISHIGAAHINAPALISG